MRRADIDVDAVVGFAQTVPDTTEGTLMLKWQPYLYVVDGCVPFPAVDENGDTRWESYPAAVIPLLILLPKAPGCLQQVILLATAIPAPVKCTPEQRLTTMLTP